MILFASTQHGEAPFDPAYLASVTINDEVAKLVFAGLRDGTFDLTRLIWRRFPLERTVKAIDPASASQADSMKIMIQP